MTQATKSIAQQTLQEMVPFMEKHFSDLEVAVTAEELEQLPIIKKYIETLKQRTQELQAAIDAIPKNNIAEEILQADRIRDRSISILRRKMQMFEESTDEAELKAYKTLNAMWEEKYETLAYLSYPVETEGIDELVYALTTAKYNNEVNTLGLNAEVEQLRQDNEAFKAAFGQDPERRETKTTNDAREVFNSLVQHYRSYCEYVKGTLEAHHEAPVKRIAKLLEINE